GHPIGLPPRLTGSTTKRGVGIRPVHGFGGPPEKFTIVTNRHNELHGFDIPDPCFSDSLLRIEPSGDGRSMDSMILCLYMLVLGILGAFGFHRAFLLYLYWRHRSRTIEPEERFKQLPLVTVQLPMFNEMYVAERLLEGVAALDYPRDKLEIQVL